ncbi:hypothetical protein K502DRAFT_340361 [Neoconidiobolus thromboides FSU 785]|nr:hypothetical protein K502DRAFT_340361 [Neoconidiobolus thromboides FSU 785]
MKFKILLLLVIVQLTFAINYLSINDIKKEEIVISNGKNIGIEVKYNSNNNKEYFIHHFNNSTIINITKLINQIENIKENTFFFIEDSLAYVDNDNYVNLIQNKFIDNNNRIQYYGVGLLYDCMDVKNIHYNNNTIIYSCSKQIEYGDENEIYNDNGKLYKQLPIRKINHFVKPDYIQQLYRAFLIIENNKYSFDSLPIDLLKFTELESPVPPYGHKNHYALSYNSQKVSFISNQISEDKEWNAYCNVYQVTTDGYELPTKIKYSKQRNCNSPTYSINNNYLAWVVNNNEVVIWDLNKDELYLNKKMDKRIIKIEFNNNKNTDNELELLMLINENGIQHLYLTNFKYSINTFFNSIKLNIDYFQLLSNQRLLLSLSSFNIPPRNYIYFIKNNTLVQLNNIDNDNHTIDNNYNNFYYYGYKQDKIHTYLFHPNNNNKLDSLVVFLHSNNLNDGFINQWSYSNNYNVFNNYYSLLINPHGSIGYPKLNINNYGIEKRNKIIYEDIKLGIQNMLIQYPTIDHNKVCIYIRGYSLPILNQFNNTMFQCVIMEDIIIDFKLNYYTSDDLNFIENMYSLPPPYAKPNKYQSNYNVNKLPTLIIHSLNNYNIDSNQAIATFTDLQLHNITSKLLLFKSNLTSKSNQSRRYYEIMNWLNKYLK